ncbi:hypothetical protein EDD63_11637 [Breznakia blatticola]|uniref:Uncharacterized protein n=1 Tax=Breznakia blatticola TaxID=1754012 RepID=A0A4R7ZQR3_9FIRM|nr:hypothetical protein EDD63_11637 [Breznakia blatticola]
MTLIQLFKRLKKDQQSESQIFELEKTVTFLEPINYELFTQKDLRFVLRAYLESRNNGERYKTIKTNDLLCTLKLMHLNKIKKEYMIEDSSGIRKKRRQILVKEIRQLFEEDAFDAWFTVIGTFESRQSMREWLDQGQQSL